MAAAHQLPPEEMFEIRRVPERGRLLMLGVLFAVLTCVGVTLVAFILMTEPGDFGLLALPSAMTSVGLLMGAFFVHSLLARRAIQEVVLELETPVLHLDDGFDFNARFTPATDLDVNSLRATFECVERAYYRAGTRSRTYTRVAWSDTLELAGQRCRQDHVVRFGGHFKTPADGMCTFVGTNHAVTWRLRIDVDIARWPDVREDFEIEVLPVLGERPPGA